jgi:hypothetical protein
MHFDPSRGAAITPTTAFIASPTRITAPLEMRSRMNAARIQRGPKTLRITSQAMSAAVSFWHSLSNGRPMPEQHADFLRSWSVRWGKRRDVNSVLGKPLRVLAETKLFEPVRNLLHCVL